LHDPQSGLLKFQALMMCQFSEPNGQARMTQGFVCFLL